MLVVNYWSYYLLILQDLRNDPYSIICMCNGHVCKYSVYSIYDFTFQIFIMNYCLFVFQSPHQPQNVIFSDILYTITIL